MLDPWLTGSTDAEPVDMEGHLYTEVKAFEVPVGSFQRDSCLQTAVKISEATDKRKDALSYSSGR